MLLITEADGVVALDGWERSSGAFAEVALARCLGKPIFDERLQQMELEMYARSMDEYEL
jgi:hypothetical protein